MKYFALLSNQGTACSETTLREDEFTPDRVNIVESQARANSSPDAPILGTWTEVSQNEAIVPQSIRASIPPITILPEHLEADGDFNGGDPETRLSDVVVINDYHFHVEAIEVGLNKHGNIFAVNPELDSDIDNIVALLGDCPAAIPFNGRDYVMFIMPFGS